MVKIDFSKLCIVIVNYKTPKETLSLIKSLREMKGGGERQVYVVDSHSEDESKNIIENELLSNEFFIEMDKNYGYGYCNNVGIRKGLLWQAEFFLILNPDIKVDKDLIFRLVIALEAQKKSGMAVPVSLSEDGKRFQSIGGKYSLFTGRAKRRGYNKKISVEQKDFEYVDFPVGDAILFKREFFEDAGLFHEKFFLYYEDVEIGLRAKREYWKCVVIPKAKVFHRDTTRERLFDPTVNYVSIRNQIWVERLYANIFQYVTFLIFSFLLRYPFKMIRAFFFCRFKCFFMIVKGIFSGVFSKEVYDGSHLNLPNITREIEEGDFIPESPRIIFERTKRK